MKAGRQIALFLLVSVGLLGVFAVWNQQNWTLRQEQRFDSGQYPGKLAILFENGNISPRVSLALYRRGISVRPNYVLVGQDGWMYLGDNFQDAATRAANGLEVLDDTLLARVSGQLRERQDWLAQQGVASLFAIVPNKHSIYPEYAPAWMPFSDHGDNGRLVAAAQSVGVNIVDTTPAIRAEKQGRQWLYNYTDTHWTYPAAFVGYSTILAALQNQGVPIEILPKDSVRFEATTYPAGGLAKLLGFARLLNHSFDRGYSVNIERPTESMCVTNIDRQFNESSECVAGPDRGIVGNYWTARQLSNPDALNDLSVLIVEDSFGFAPSRFYNNSFTTVWHAHLGFILNGERLKHFVQKFRPDIVVYMVVERNLLRPLAYEFDGASGIVEAPRE